MEESDWLKAKEERETMLTQRVLTEEETKEFKKQGETVKMSKARFLKRIKQKTFN